MDLFENTIKQIKKASDLMNLDKEIQRVLSCPQRKIEVKMSGGHHNRGMHLLSIGYIEAVIYRFGISKAEPFLTQHQPI